ncbi:ABC transporter permease [Trinickia sp.]|uniref:ABC transporter permease n=1 Tax=Trinickia sp. TaxID=2571163 RepID=UPI003F7D7120
MISELFGRRRAKPNRGAIRGWLSTFVGVAATLFGLLLATFLIGRTIPIDPVVAIVGDRATPDVVARVRADLGLDRPLLEQFWIYLRHLAHGDLGTSVMTSRSVVEDVLHFFPATLELATTAIVIAVLIGVPLGVISASRQGSPLDNAVRIVSLAGQSTPVFVLGLLALLVFYVKFGIAPGIGQQDMGFQGAVPERTGALIIDAALDGQWDAFRDGLAHLVLPSLVLAYVSFSTITRMTRTFMLDALNGEFIVTARAKGLSASRVLWRHAFLNVAGRLVMVIVLAYAGLLEGAVLTETVFGWPGLGLYLTQSLMNADMNAVLGATLVIGGIYITLNQLADMAYRILDPRAKS